MGPPKWKIWKVSGKHPFGAKNPFGTPGVPPGGLKEAKKNWERNFPRKKI